MILARLLMRHSYILKISKKGRYLNEKFKKDGYADFNFGNAYNRRSGKCFG